MPKLPSQWFNRLPTFQKRKFKIKSYYKCVWIPLTALQINKTLASLIKCLLRHLPQNLSVKREAYVQYNYFPTYFFSQSFLKVQILSSLPVHNLKILSYGHKTLMLCKYILGHLIFSLFFSPLPLAVFIAAAWIQGNESSCFCLL